MSIAERALDESKRLFESYNKRLAEIKEDYRPSNNYVTMAQEITDVAEFTLKAVEKQIPVYIPVDLVNEKRDRKLMLGIFKCPMCGNAIKRGHNYCDYCGQALKWEE